MRMKETAYERLRKANPIAATVEETSLALHECVDKPVLSHSDLNVPSSNVCKEVSYPASPKEKSVQFSHDTKEANVSSPGKKRHF